MRTLLQTVIQLTWALWFGGLITVFISVLALFHHDHSLAVQTAPLIFHAFETYQLILAAVAVVGALLWRRKSIVILFALAAAGSVVSPLVITPQISELQRQGLTHTDQFGKLHGESMMVYTTDAALLLAVGLILPHAAASNRASH